MEGIEKIGKDLIEEGQPFVVAKVVDTEGSTPRKKGAWLLMKQNGERYGTVGGGKLEAEVEKIALETFQTKENKIHRFRLTGEDQQSLDMRCGGDADISIEYIDPDKPETFQVDFTRPDIAYIFGGGHVGKAISPVLNYVGFQTVILDDREEYACKERFPEAIETIVLESYEKAFKDITTDENSYIVIVTRGHMGDYDVLKNALQNPAAYIGMIGSRKKVAELYRMLKEEGFAQEQIDEVYSPIGLSIKAETPEEIGVSIAAEMIKVRAEKE